MKRLTRLKKQLVNHVAAQHPSEPLADCFYCAIYLLQIKGLSKAK